MTRKQYEAMQLRRRTITIVVSTLLLAGMFCGWLRQDKNNDSSYKEALATSIRQHAYSNQTVIDEASAQCMGR